MNEDDELIRYWEYKKAKWDMRKEWMQDKSSKDSRTLKFYPVIAIKEQRNEKVNEAWQFMKSIQKN